MFLWNTYTKSYIIFQFTLNIWPYMTFKGQIKATDIATGCIYKRYIAWWKGFVWNKYGKSYIWSSVSLKHWPVKSRSLSFQLTVFHKQSKLWLKFIRNTYRKPYVIFSLPQFIRNIWLKGSSRSHNVKCNISLSNCPITVNCDRVLFLEMQYLTSNWLTAQKFVQWCSAEYLHVCRVNVGHIAKSGQLRVNNGKYR